MNEEILDEESYDLSDELIHEALIFSPVFLSLIEQNDSEIIDINNNIHVKRIQVKYRDSKSLKICISRYSNDNNQPIVDDFRDESGLEYIMDILARVIAIEDKDPNTNELVSCLFSYNRLDVSCSWKIFITSSYGYQELQLFDFLLGQYSYYDNLKTLQQTEKMINVDGNIPTLTTQKSSNIVATGFEGTGNLIRTSLKTSGQATGYAIRSLGKLYTSAAVHSRKLLSSDTKEISSDNSTKVIDDDQISKAIKHKERAEVVHAGAKSLTGAALYPVRWTGRKASQWANQGNNNLDLSVTNNQGIGVSSSESGTNRKGIISTVTMDTLGGLGNAVVSICKGVTEAIGEVGSAIGDSALHHSRTIHGDAYASEVTKHYVSAASEIGLASYKVMNVMALGVGGVLADAAIEGTTLLVCLSDFLIGPIVLQGYCEMIQLPELKPKKYFVVLRPWSIAFYRSAKDVMNRPHRIVITAMLDTLPQLRYYENINKFESSLEDMIYNTYQEEKIEQTDNPMLNKISDSNSNSDNSNDREDEESNVEGSNKNSHKFVDKLLHNQRAHIEFCTVDCSTFLLFPISYINPDGGERKLSIDLLEWYNELKLASFRVETIGKNKSGAEDIALDRRLLLLPKENFLYVECKFILIDYELSNIQTTNDLVSKRGNFNVSDYIVLKDKQDVSSPIDETLDNDIDMNSIDNEIDNEIKQNQEDSLTKNQSNKNHSTTSLSSLLSNSITNYIINPFKKSALTALRIRLVPLTDKGLYVKGECFITDFIPLSTVPSKSEDKSIFEMDQYNYVNDVLSTLFNNITISRLRDNSSQYVTYEENNSLEIGKKFSLSLIDIKYLIVTVQGRTVFGSTLEIGRAKILLSNISNQLTNIWLPLTHLSSKVHVGYVLLKLQMKIFENNDEISATV